MSRFFAFFWCIIFFLFKNKIINNGADKINNTLIRTLPKKYPILLNTTEQLSRKKLRAFAATPVISGRESPPL